MGVRDDGGMSASTPRSARLAAVERSPQAVVAHDRAAWVGLFGADGQVEDPVGSRPHVGRAAIERFYDTFIGPRTITFRRDTDIVLGDTVVRDVELEVVMGKSVRMRIPAYLRYDLTDVAGELKITRLQAFWELPAMIGQFVRSGVAAVPAGLGLSGALLRNQGLGGAGGFLTGLRTGGRRAKRLVSEVLTAAASGDELAVRRRLSEPVQITRGDGVRMGISELAAELAGARVQKLIAAGRFVVAGTDRNGERGVVIAEMTPGRPAIGALRLFVE
ncbi:hypothetical protein ABIA30_001114 [Mycobacterium sp. MAA66]